MKKLAVNIARLILAVAFILSGFVKAVDPLGTQYKIQDYLVAMGLGRLIPDFMTLSASVLLSTIEFILGCPSAYQLADVLEEHRAADSCGHRVEVSIADAATHRRG